MAATETHIARIGDVEGRTIARWAAENHLAALRLGVAAPERVALLGRELTAAADRAPTSDPGLEMVTVRVGPAGTDAVLARLVGFVAGRGGAMRVGLPRLALAAVAALVIGSLAWAAGGAAWHVMGHSAAQPSDGPAGFVGEPPAAPQVDVAPIVALNPFGAVPEAEPAAPVAETALDLVLRGVLMNPDPDRSMALISAAGPARGYRPGDAVSAQAILVEILAGHVVLEVDGRREILSFPERDGPGARRAGPTQDAGLNRLRDVLGRQNADATPASDDVQGWLEVWRERIRRNPGEAVASIGLTPTEDGYMVAERHDAALRRAGLRAGDVVTRVNGQAVGDADRDRALFDEVAASGLARVEVRRGGRVVTLTFPLK